MRASRKLVVLGVAVVVLCCAAIAYAFVHGNAGMFRMPNAAMEPTIKAGATFRADMSAYETADPRRWDLVVFRAPQNEKVNKNLKQGQVWVFRVVGLPGETISFDKSGLLIDGQPAELPNHLGNNSYSGLAVDTSGVDHPFVVPQSSYYVLGDNSATANDSRIWGEVARANILGRVNDR